MKKFFNIYDHNEEERIKDKLIDYSDIPKEYISFLKIYYKENHYVHIAIIDDAIGIKSNLVLLHGLGGSSLLYYKLFKELMSKYIIYAIDLPGLGCSSRDKFEAKSVTEAEDYFVENIKFCFDKLNIKKFHLLGHSFGGYISSLFTLRYPEMINKLILLSPIGLSSTYDEYKKFNKIENFIRQLCYKFNITPSTGLDFLGLFKRIAMNFFIGNKLKSLDDKGEYNVNKDFIDIIYCNRFTSEKSIFIFFNKNIQPYKPITYHYELLINKKVLILFGEHDWVPIKQAEDLKKLLGDDVSIDTVSNSGHLLHVDNPKEVILKILKFLE